ncbi:uncharacterized protein LOC131690161 [Topomyia yanbarensis]|uniref:uncharacterized protein LOC131690161 n=1 Tax=Topomyia yanbarensis TaxID=2498891 RepID=UPI00273BBBD3|nr:uncharacterized protein LOC131690161 [Topomyia yanbarensis]XP_058831714.1 uncharacterized protein LOC131690161 [Topomyia yanbarensis]XP_058831723.1 uncharacterized protein LOC131690161 [Topomyia yanbarensis]XP_058831731.1 uncharacterized protein LOC131690161 [Topomyia yanbarensis]
MNRNSKLKRFYRYRSYKRKLEGGGNGNSDQSSNSNKQAKQERIHEDASIPSIAIGVVPYDYPSQLLDIEEARQIRSAVLKEMVAQRATNPIKPQFTRNAILRTGWMVFHCADEGTAKWIEELDYWGTVNCNAVRESDIPSGLSVVGSFPQSAEDTTEFILGMIEAQNDLPSSKWKLLNRNNGGDVAILTLEVDNFSWQKLEEKKFEITFKYGQLHFKPGGKRN